LAKVAKIDAGWQVLERISWLSGIGCRLAKSTLGLPCSNELALTGARPKIVIGSCGKLEER
jgi:hypothetical protein